MPIYDVTLPVTRELMVWDGDPAVGMEHNTFDVDGNPVTVTTLRLGAHTGTHLDAPRHFVPGGATVEALDLSVLIGPARVIEIDESVGAITAAVLDGLDWPDGVERVLFKTRNSALWADPTQAFVKDFVAILEDGARWLVERGVRLVGVDYLSVAPFDAAVGTHRALLDASVVIVEGLDLRAVGVGEYQLICLPLKLVGSDGSPVRAVLVG